jgi:hypothetical protein
MTYDCWIVSIVPGDGSLPIPWRAEDCFFYEEEAHEELDNYRPFDPETPMAVYRCQITVIEVAEDNRDGVEEDEDKELADD